MDLKGIGGLCVDWMYLVQSRIQQQTLGTKLLVHVPLKRFHVLVLPLMIVITA
jgi:hypothetical protein